MVCLTTQGGYLMKKSCHLLLVSLLTASTFALAAEVDLDGLTVFPLNELADNTLTIVGHSSGAYSSGICRIIIRSNSNTMEPDFRLLAERFKFTHGIGGMPEEDVSLIETHYALMYKLMKTDFGFEHIIMESKDGKSIGENVSALFGDNTVAVIAGTCYKSDLP